MKNNKPYLAALSYSLFVGLSFLVTKLVLPYASAGLILAHRFTIAFMAYLLYLLISKKRLSVTKHVLKATVTISLFYPLLFFTLQLYGLQGARSSDAGIIFATVPIMIILLSLFLGKVPSKLQTLSILLSVTGVIYMFMGNLSLEARNPIAILLLFLSALSFAIYTIMVNKLLKNLSVHQLTFMIISIAFIAFNSFYIVGQPSLTSALVNYWAPLSTPSYLMGIIYLGFFASVAASFASNYALKFLSAAQFSVFSNLSTLISIIAGAILLGESLTPRHYLATLLIILGLLGTNFATSIEARYLKGKKLNGMK